MLKRIATLLLGIGLIGLGVFFFVTPERSYALQLLTRYWPVFLILAGLVRVAGYLIDRHPSSPVGGLMITAVGGILIAANLTGEHSLIRIFGTYWFLLLLAYIIGRVLRQYTHRSEFDKRPAAFSAGAVAVMVLIAGTGLGANYLGRNQEYIKKLNARIERVAGIRDYLFGNRIEIEDEPARSIDLTGETRLLVDGSTGDVSITASDGKEAMVRLIKRVRTTDEAEGRALAGRIRLSVARDGAAVRVSVNAPGIESDYTTSLLITLPAAASIPVEVANTLGETSLRGLRGDHRILNGEQIEVLDHTGAMRIENPRGAISLRNIRGNVELIDYARNAELREISGAVRIESKGGNTVIEQSTGPLKARINDARLEIDGLSGQPATSDEALALIEESRNSRLDLRNIRGDLRINALNTRIGIDTLSGNLTIDNSSGRTVASHLTGQATIKSKDGSIEIDGVTGPVVAQSSQEIIIRDFRSSIDASSRIGRIEISSDEKITGAIRAVSEKGRIRASFPEDSAFKLDAMTEFGRVRIRGFEQLNYARRERTSVQAASLTEPVATLTFRTVSGDIQIQSSGTAIAAR